MIFRLTHLHSECTPNHDIYITILKAGTRIEP